MASMAFDGAGIDGAGERSQFCQTMTFSSLSRIRHPVTQDRSLHGYAVLRYAEAHVGNVSAALAFCNRLGSVDRAKTVNSIPK